jgi:hypothetical protein
MGGSRGDVQFADCTGRQGNFQPQELFKSQKKGFALPRIPSSLLEPGGG